MKRKVPIEDLLLYLETKEDSFERKNNLLDFILEHYETLTNIKIKIEPQAMINNLCFCDCGDIDKLPQKEGIVLYNIQNNKIGIICNVISSNNMHIFTLNEKGFVYRENFEEKRWDRWGALSSIYYYNNYEAGIDKNIGERDLKRNLIGKDVLLLQQFLQLKNFKDVIVCGEFEINTENAVKIYQFYRGIESTGVIKKEDIFDFLR